MAPIAVAWAQPVTSHPPSPTPLPPLVLEPFRLQFQPAFRSPADLMSIAPPVKPPAARDPSELEQITLGLPGGRPAYFVDLDGRFDGPLLVPLRAPTQGQPR